jgi:folate-binding Fe-S cluster repair protein YgfZ
MASELLEPQLADLKKYAVFSKSKLTDESAAWVRFGLDHGDAALAASALNCLRKPTAWCAMTG